MDGNDSFSDASVSPSLWAAAPKTRKFSTRRCAKYTDSPADGAAAPSSPGRSPPGCAARDRYFRNPMLSGVAAPGDPADCGRQGSLAPRRPGRPCSCGPQSANRVRQYAASAQKCGWRTATDHLHRSARARPCWSGQRPPRLRRLSRCEARTPAVRTRAELPTRLRLAVVDQADRPRSSVRPSMLAASRTVRDGVGSAGGVAVRR